MQFAPPPPGNREREREEEILDFKLNEALLFPIGVSGFQNSREILAPV